MPNSVTAILEKLRQQYPELEEEPLMDELDAAVGGEELDEEMMDEEAMSDEDMDMSMMFDDEEDEDEEIIPAASGALPRPKPRV